MEIAEFQQLISRRYEKRDRQRGVPLTFMWFIEEVGELATALASDNKTNKEEEFADCLAWLLSVASILGIDAEEAMAKYRDGCPKCHCTPCRCDEDRIRDS